MRRLALLAMAIALALSCTSEARLPVATLRSGSALIVAELARSQEEQTKGLMFRESLPDGQGMLFIYGSDRRMSFWMKNTKVDLSIAFLAADGLILEIHDMKRESLEVIDSERSARYALEAPLGWFDRIGLKAGDRFEIPPEASKP
jgi:uncharacterized protein